MVYVLNINGQPLMPTQRHGKVRRLLKAEKAKVIKRCPFTIQLLYETQDNVQPVSLGVDAGSKYIGISATTEEIVLYEAEIELRNDIVKLLSDRREQRRGRRNRKTRYRKPRFNNRRRKDGWLAPSVQNKVDSHLTAIRKVHEILPVTKVIVEVASFDIQKIKNLDIKGTEYQKGEQLGFWNVREYVLWRDNHECQYCHGKSKDPVLNVHHIESRKTGGNAPNNLITLCETCHHDYHQGKIKLNIKRGNSYKDATFMGIMRWALYNKLKELYPNIFLTYGYITKHLRIKYNFPKEHYVDARCISGNPQAIPLDYIFYQRKIRCHNRKLHRATVCKGGKRKNNQLPKHAFGFQLFDKVKLPNKIVGFVFGRKSNGSMLVKSISGDYIKEITRNKLIKLEKRRNILISLEKVK